MKKFEVIYDTSTCYSDTIFVQARDVTSARKKADKEANQKFNYPKFASIRELVPVDLIVHERMIKERDDQIDKLKKQVARIRQSIASEGSSWTREAAQKDGGGFTDAEIIQAYENKW